MKKTCFRYINYTTIVPDNCVHLPFFVMLQIVFMHILAIVWVVSLYNKRFNIARLFSRAPGSNPDGLAKLGIFCLALIHARASPVNYPPFDFVKLHLNYKGHFYP
jgi:hypothetical protein